SSPTCLDNPSHSESRRLLHCSPYPHSVKKKPRLHARADLCRFAPVCRKGTLAMEPPAAICHTRSSRKNHDELGAWAWPSSRLPAGLGPERLPRRGAELWL